MKVTREKAVAVLESLTQNTDWCELMDDAGLYTIDSKGIEDWATVYDIFEALGVTRAEVNLANLYGDN